MYCTNCGKQIDDNAAYCPYCGVPAANRQQQLPVPQAAAPNRGLVTAAKVFIIIAMVCGFWYILPLIFGGIALSKMKTGKPSTAICICTLLFCNIIAGVLLLCTSEADYF